MAGEWQAAKWQSDLGRAWLYRQLIFLCGNIRDLCPYCLNDKDEIRLLDLDDYLAEWAGRSVISLQVFDPEDRFSWVISEEERLVETGSAQREPASGDAEPMAGIPEGRPRGDRSGIITSLHEIARYLTSGSKRCCVVQFAERLAAEKADDPDRSLALLILQKLVHDMKPDNRLILTYLFADDIPRSLSVNEPRSTIVEIPYPERRDVQEVFKRHFGLREDAAVTRAVNACHGLTLREIKTVVEHLGGLADLDLLEREIRGYKYGETRNYWDELNLKRLQQAPTELKEKIKGQDYAVDKVKQVLVRARADIQRTTGGRQGRPRGALFFAGPTGVGKTMMAQLVAKFLFGDEKACLRIDMSEYQQDFQVSRLYGAPPGFVGYEQGGQLTGPVQANPFRVILFDEFEKADKRVFDIFLQILDDGRLTDSRGVVAHFSESFIIFTSNVGTRAKEKDPTEQLEARLRIADPEIRVLEIREYFMECVERYFRTELGRPELLNRIGRDNIVVFDHIDNMDVAREIIVQELRTIRDAFDKSYEYHKPSLALSMDVERVADALLAIDEQRIRQYGGREVSNLVNERVRDGLADLVLDAEMQAEEHGLTRAVVHCLVDKIGLRFELRPE